MREERELKGHRKFIKHAAPTSPATLPHHTLPPPPVPSVPEPSIPLFVIHTCIGGYWWLVFVAVNAIFYLRLYIFFAFLPIRHLGLAFPVVRAAKGFFQMHRATLRCGVSGVLVNLSLTLKSNFLSGTAETEVAVRMAVHDVELFHEHFVDAHEDLVAIRGDLDGGAADDEGGHEDERSQDAEHACYLKRTSK